MVEGVIAKVAEQFGQHIVASHVDRPEQVSDHAAKSAVRIQQTKYDGQAGNIAYDNAGQHAQSQPPFFLAVGLFHSGLESFAYPGYHIHVNTQRTDHGTIHPSEDQGQSNQYTDNQKRTSQQSGDKLDGRQREILLGKKAGKVQKEKRQQGERHQGQNDTQDP